MSGAETDPVALLHVHEADGEREVELFNHGAGCLTDADKAAGWTETPLYAAPSPAGDDVGRLREALEPFARVARINAPLAADWPDDLDNSHFIPSAWPTWGDFKRADQVLAALSDTSPTEGEGA